MGEEWHESYIEVKRLHWEDLARYDNVDTTKTTNADVEKMITGALADLFVNGKAPSDSNELIDMTAEDLKDFDIEAQTTIYKCALGEVDPNA